MLVTLLGKWTALDDVRRTLLGDAQPAVADLFLVNIQANVIHLFHGEPPWFDSESALALSSAFSTKRSPDLFIQTSRDFARVGGTE